MRENIKLLIAKIKFDAKNPQKRTSSKLRVCVDYIDSLEGEVTQLTYAIKHRDVMLGKYEDKMAEDRTSITALELKVQQLENQLNTLEAERRKEKSWNSKFASIVKKYQSA